MVDAIFGKRRNAVMSTTVAAAVLWVGLVPGLATTRAEGPSAGQTVAAPSGGETLNSMLWLAGQWRSEEGGQLSEETWSVPHGGSMVGMWRLLVDGTPKVIELLSLTVEGDAVVLRLRHFDGRLVAREEKGAPITLKRVQAGAKMAVFESPGASGPLTISYRVEGNDLVGTVKHAGGEPETYRMRRVSLGVTGSIAK